MDKLITTLLQIEHSLRLVREELAQKFSQNAAPELGAIDFQNMSEITPAKWGDWFSASRYQTPTLVNSYSEIFPDLCAGYSKTNFPALSVEQYARISNNSAIKYFLNIWLIVEIDWLTLELRIPTEIYKHFKMFYFVWSVSMDTAQSIKLWMYEKTVNDEEIRTLVDARFYTPVGVNEIYTIKPSPRNDIIETKLYFEFETSTFHLIKIEDARLYAPTASPAVGQG